MLGRLASDRRGRDRGGNAGWIDRNLDTVLAGAPVAGPDGDEGPQSQWHKKEHVEDRVERGEQKRGDGVVA